MKKHLTLKFGAIIFAVLSLFVLLMPNIGVVYAQTDAETNCKASILIERSTKKVLKENNCDERLPIASVTKLMTILLTLERISAGEFGVDDVITVSENASGMGGSQIFLDANAEYKIGELLKSVIVASANDSSVALAEHIAGSENNFVKLMNEKATALGLTNTNYANCTGLPSESGYSSARDQAIVLNEVLNYDLYHEYSSIWLEDFTHPSGRTTQMANTNKLSRFYDGCIGGKTGSTNQAKYCLAVGAKRNDMELISVVLGADNSKARFNIASNLLNEGFSEYCAKNIFDASCVKDKTIRIKGLDRVTHIAPERGYSIICKKDEQPNYSLNYNLPALLTEVKTGEVVGNVEIVVDGVVVDRINLLSTETHEEASLFDYIKQITQ